MAYLGSFAREGGTILMATNIVSEVQNFADHMILIDEAKIKLDLPMKEVPERFVKLRKKFGQDQDVFKDPSCVQVTLNSDTSISYLVHKSEADKYGDNALLVDHRRITAEEIFLYYTKRSQE